MRLGLRSTCRSILLCSPAWPQCPRGRGGALVHFGLQPTRPGLLGIMDGFERPEVGGKPIPTPPLPPIPSDPYFPGGAVAAGCCIPVTYLKLATDKDRCLSCRRHGRKPITLPGCLLSAHKVAAPRGRRQSVLVVNWPAQSLTIVSQPSSLD